MKRNIAVLLCERTVLSISVCLPTLPAGLQNFGMRKRILPRGEMRNEKLVYQLASNDKGGFPKRRFEYYW